MSATYLFAQINRLNLSAVALAAVGAELALRLEGTEGDPPTRTLLRQVARAVDPAMLEALSTADMAQALGFVRAFLLEAVELLDAPARNAGWRHTDPALLEAMGIGSRSVVRRIAAMAATRPDLAALLDGPGRFLDIGTGAGQLAIAAAELWPNLEVVGIDIWEPALTIARAAVAASAVAARVEVRRQDMLDLEAQESFSLIWLPTQFPPGPVVEAAVPRLHAALVPGGWLVLGLQRIPEDPLGGAAARLRVTRSGGRPWQPYELAARLEAAGFEAVEMLESPAGASNVIGRRGLR